MIKCIEVIIQFNKNDRVLLWYHPRMRFNVSLQKRHSWGWEDNGGSFNIPTIEQAKSIFYDWSKNIPRSNYR